jgi:hypothetical protein
MSDSDIGFKAAYAEAKKGSEEGGVPIGAALVSADGKVLGQGHNMRIQKSSATLHVGNQRPSFQPFSARSVQVLTLSGRD